jgi:8-oxo-dGTP pyrophosphatase MutT (NUDIX family)
MKPLALAATIIIMREAVSGPPELLMLERASTMAFAGGALVFPGGRVEQQDFELAGQLDHPGERDEVAQRIAAIRETIEEAGIAIGLTPHPDLVPLAALRSGLAEGLPFVQLLNDAGLSLDLGTLSPFARWIPPADVPRRFDTRFYLAAAPEGAIEQADGGESVRALWATARALLDDDEAGHHRVIFPTWCNLDRLARFASIEEARADGALYAHHLASGMVEKRDGVDWLCVEEGIGYPNTARPLKSDLRR